MKKLTIFLAFLLFAGFNVIAQMQITGTVTSADDGLPIPGVSVVVKGNSSIGISTDIDGKYTLTVPKSAVSLVFTSVGMKTIEENINGRSIIDIKMESDVVGLDEVVVLGYSTKGKNSITGSTIQVKGDDLKNVPAISVDQTLQGKVAGLAISTSSGSPGATQDIRIRGIGSVTAGNNPLYVIDGVPVISGNISGSKNVSSLSLLATLNSSDVKTITVLKDASATSAYGARGSNGVIVITTKKGRKGTTKFNFTSYYGFQNSATEGRDVLTGTQREELLLESIYNTFGKKYGFEKENTLEWANKVSFWGVDKLNKWIEDGRIETDWDKEVKNENAPTYNLTLSASGGDEISSFYASLGYNKTESTIVGSEFRRISGTLNYSRKLFDNVKLTTNNSVANTLQEGLLLEQGSFFGSPLMAKYFISPWNRAYTNDGEPDTSWGGIYNWLYLKDHDVTFNNLTRATSNSNIEWEIIKNLKFKTAVSLDFAFANYKNFSNRVYGDSSDEKGTVVNSDRRIFNLVTQNSLSYNYSLNEHNFQALVLMEYQENKNNYLYAYGENFADDGVTNLDNSSANWKGEGNYTDWSNVSYLGMINYNFNGKYIVDLTYRREGSSRFGEGKRFGNFWALGGAWNITRESFMSDIEFIDNLRLRASYGVSGNSLVKLNTYQELLGYAANYASSGASYPSTYGNPNLTWEKNKTFDLGIDFAFVNNRVKGSVSYYNKTTYDLLLDVPLSRTLGYELLPSNVGEMVNKGVEFLTDLAVVQTKDFNVNLSFNIATLENEVTDLAKDPFGEVIAIETEARRTDVGHPIREWHMRKYAGVDSETGLAQWYLNGKDGEVTNDYYEAKAAFQGTSALPKYTGGFGLHVDFKGVYLDANFYYAGGHQVFESYARYVHHDGLYPTYSYNGTSDLMNRWQKPGDITDVPKQVFGSGNNTSRTSTRFLFDGDYVRLKDLVLGYNLPKKIVEKARLKGANIYVRGTNLWTWVKDEKMKYDPEVRIDGLTRLTNPPIKTVSVGLNFNF